MNTWLKNTHMGRGVFYKIQKKYERGVCLFRGSTDTYEY